MSFSWPLPFVFPTGVEVNAPSPPLVSFIVPFRSSEVGGDDKSKVDDNGKLLVDASVDAASSLFSRMGGS